MELKNSQPNLKVVDVDPKMIDQLQNIYVDTCYQVYMLLVRVKITIYW